MQIRAILLGSVIAVMVGGAAVAADGPIKIGVDTPLRGLAEEPSVDLDQRNP